MDAIAPTQTDAVTFAGSRPAFRNMVLRGGMLELATLGFYRFWLATDIRRHLWSNTAVAGDVAEYTGTARELLIGFLVAIAILAPIYIVYFLIGVELERLSPFASIPLVLFTYLFAQFAIYRARRYRVTRTVWRGLRFSMGGSGWNYAFRAGLWLLLVIVTLGIALPWRMAALERFRMRNTAYGSLQGRFEGTGGGLFKQVWFLALLAIPSAFLVIPLPFIYAAFRAIVLRWWINGVRLGDVGFHSRLEGTALFGCYWKAIGWMVPLAILLGLWSTAVFMTAFNLGGFTGTSEEIARPVSQHPAVLIGIAAGYLVMAVGTGAVMRIYLGRDIWAKAAATASVYNLTAADDIAGQGTSVGALGEGFADSLDVAGF